MKEEGLIEMDSGVRLFLSLFNPPGAHGAPEIISCIFHSQFSYSSYSLLSPPQTYLPAHIMAQVGDGSDKGWHCKRSGNSFTNPCLSSPHPRDAF